jgi:TPR repeat protein
VAWYRKAADQGVIDAQFNLGIMYVYGSGVQDYVQAHMWWNLAAVSGDEDAIKNRDKVAKKMTPAQIAEAQKLAREWKPTD